MLRILLGALLVGFVVVLPNTDDLFAGQPQRPPNIIVILADDLGWDGLSCYGNDFHETPHLDALAADGMRFERAYAAAPVCSPFRASLLTGLHPARIGITDYLRPNSANSLSTHYDTIAEVLRAQGYATGMIGKWHLSGYKYHGAENEITPADHGFDWDTAREIKGVGNGANFWPYVFRTQPIRWLDLAENRLGENEYLTDRLNLEAVEFIRRQKDQPFFLYLSHYAPHTILNGRPDLVAKYRAKRKPGASSRERCYLCEDAGHEGDPLNHWASESNPHLAAMVESIDSGIGAIRAELERLGLAEDTLIVFTSDNGGETNVTTNGVLRGGKSQLYEGGVRVPLIIAWPEKIHAGRESTVRVTNLDLFPTLAACAGIPAASFEELDGASMFEHLVDTTHVPADRALYWHYPLDKPHFLGGESAGSIVDGPWKLIEFYQPRRFELFNLESDPGERHDLSEEEPNRVRELAQKLMEWREKVGAHTPSPPMVTEARSLVFADHLSESGISDRWAFNASWIAKEGVLRSTEFASGGSRIFAKNIEFADAIVRFDFQFGNASDLRLVTGADGRYNTVVHFRPDEFFIQTAKDASVPYFSYRHGACGFRFEKDQWYSMTVEFVGDTVIAHIDGLHCVIAQHPLIKRTRDYFAFQVDSSAALIDNVQILSVRTQDSFDQRLARARALSDRHPALRTVEEAQDIQRKNAHEWLYQRDADYRALVLEVDRLDAMRASAFPAAYATVKSQKRGLLDRRKRALAEDSHYKTLLFAMYRARRAIDKYVVGQHPELERLHASERAYALEKRHREQRDDEGYRKCVEAFEAAEKTLHGAYPALFMSDEKLLAARDAEREKLKMNSEHRRMCDERAAAYRAQQAYLHDYLEQKSR